MLPSNIPLLGVGLHVNTLERLPGERLRRDLETVGSKLLDLRPFDTALPSGRRLRSFLCLGPYTFGKRVAPVIFSNRRESNCTYHIDPWSRPRQFLLRGQACPSISPSPHKAVLRSVLD